MSKPMGALAVDLPLPSPPNASLTQRTPVSPSPTNERRQFGRHRCNVQTACVIISLVDPVLITVRLRDLSMNGVGLLMSNRVSPGTFLAIKLHGGQGKSTRIVRAQVIHATILKHPRGWLMGCRFVDTLRREDVTMLIV